MFEVGLIIGLVVGFSIGFYLAAIYTVHKLTKDPDPVDERDDDEKMDRDPFTKQIILTPAAVELLEKLQQEPGVKVNASTDRLKEGERVFKAAVFDASAKMDEKENEK